MKYFKRIASVLATTVMLGSTVAFAAAAWPDPFVKSGAGDAAVVYGASSVGSTDMAAATTIQSALSAKVTVSSTTPSEGDKVKLEKSNNLFNLGDNMNTFYATMDSEQLSKVLADGIYTNDANNEYDYEQSIAIGSKTLGVINNDDFNDGKPTIGLAFAHPDHVLNYTLEFTPDAAEGGAALVNLETTDLTMLGVSYYILDAVNTSVDNVKLTLLDNANSATVSENEETTVAVGDTNYVVKINYVAETSTILEVNGVKTNKLVEGDVFKVGTDTYVAIKNILYNSKESGISQVEFSVGSGKIVLQNGDEVKMNDKALSETTDMVLTSYITQTGNTIEEIVLEWDVDDDFWVAPGTDLVLPGFKTIKLSMAGFNAPKSEVTSFKAASDEYLQVKTTIKDGALELPLLYNNNTDILGLGEKAKHKLVTAATATGTNLSLNVTENSMFVVTYIDGDDGYTYAYEIDSITENDGKNTTTLKNLAGGSDISFSEVGKTKDVADFTLTLQAANKDLKTASINVTSGSRGTLSFNRVVTKEGLSFRLPVSNATLAADGNINLSAVSPHTWDMNITEEDKDDTILGGGSVVVTFGINVDDGLEPTTLTGGLTSATMYETEDSSRQYVGWLSTDLATKFFWDKPSSSLKSLEVTYAGEQSSADVYVSEAAVSFTGSSTIKVVKDTEIDSVKDKNLLVVGGSCINTVAAKLLGSDTPLCGSAFSAKTTVGAGQYLIQVIASPYNAQKVAMLVAGYEAADTTAAAAKVNEGTTSTDVGTKVVGPVAA